MKAKGWATKSLIRLFDYFEQFWESKSTGRLMGSFMLLTFLLTLLLIQLNIWGIRFGLLSEFLGTNHFFAIEIVFTLLLFFEIISLIINLSKSVAISMAKQFEIFSLILLRKAFKEIGHLDDPINWASSFEPLFHVLLDTAAAILIFAGIVIFKNIAKHKPITENKLELNQFNISKKIVSLFLFVSFIGIGVYDLSLYIFLGEHHDFFNSFYALLIFSDILIVIISLRYSNRYLILFRNSGFAVATVLIRLALSAPVYYNLVLGLSAMLIVVSLSYTYNRFSKTENYDL